MRHNLRFSWIFSIIIFKSGSDTPFNGLCQVFYQCIENVSWSVRTWRDSEENQFISIKVLVDSVFTIDVYFEGVGSYEKQFFFFKCS